MHDNGPEEVCDEWIWEPDLFVVPMSRNPRDMGHPFSYLRTSYNKNPSDPCERFEASFQEN